MSALIVISAMSSGMFINFFLVPHAENYAAIFVMSIYKDSVSILTQTTLFLEISVLTDVRIINRTKYHANA